jgi:hypothetical protein
MRTVKKAAIFGATVNRLAFTLLYPKAEIIVGRKREERVDRRNDEKKG